MKGKIVKTKTGEIGITTGEKLNGKIIVHVGEKKLLCAPLSLKLIGFSD